MERIRAMEMVKEVGKGEGEIWFAGSWGVGSVKTKRERRIMRELRTWEESWVKVKSPTFPSSLLKTVHHFFSSFSSLTLHRNTLRPP